MLIYVDFIVLIALIDCFDSFAFLPHRLWRIAWAFWAVFLLPFYCPFYCLFIGVARAVAFAFSFYLAVMVFYFSFQPAKLLKIFYMRKNFCKILLKNFVFIRFRRIASTFIPKFVLNSTFLLHVTPVMLHFLSRKLTETSF